jgi:antirestriction protein ArdC
MPDTTAFDSMEEYYSTLFHELTHSTGHPSRLNRSTLMDSELFGDQNHSREELVAEMGAAFFAESLASRTRPSIIVLPIWRTGWMH